MMIFYCTVCNKLPGSGHGHSDPVQHPKKRTETGLTPAAASGGSGDLETGGGDSHFTPVRYHKWIRHLTSDAHQEKVWARWGSFVKQNRRMPLDQDRFVVVGLNRGLDNFGLAKIGAWLSEFGVVTELMYMKEEGIAIVTLMGVGFGFDCRNSEARKEAFANEETDPKGYPIRVFPRGKVLEDGFLWYTISTGLLKRELEIKVRELFRNGVRFGRQRDQLEENKKEGEGGAVEGKGEVAGFSGGGFKAGGKENRVMKKEEVVVKNEGNTEGKKGKKNNNKRKKGKRGWEEGTGSKFGGEAGKVVEIDKIWTGMTGKKMEVPKKWKTEEELLLVPEKEEKTEKVEVKVASVQEGLGVPVDNKVGQEKELEEPEKKKEEDQTDSVKESEEAPKKSEIGEEKDVEEPVKEGVSTEEPEKEKEDKTAVDSLKEPETAPKKSEVGPVKKEEEIGKEKDLEEPLKKVVSTEELEKKKEEDQTDSVKEPEEAPKKSEVGQMEEKEPQKEVEIVKEPQKEAESVKEPQEPQKGEESLKEPQKELKEPEKPVFNPLSYWSTPLPDIELPPF